MSIAWVLVFFAVNIVNNDVDVSIVKPSQGFYLSSNESKCNKIKEILLDMNTDRNLNAVCFQIYHVK